MKKSIEMQLLKSVSILYAEDCHGDKEQASCFFLSTRKEGGHHYLVTSKHVLKGKIKAHVYMDQYHKDTDSYTRHKKLTLHLNDSVRYHPDCDLALLCIDGIARLNTEKDRYVYETVLLSWIPKEPDQFSCFQEILMLGYPSGICDTVSNLPIARTGITATPLWNDYNGKAEFLIDIPFLSGASGSPVFVLGKEEVWLVGIECSTLVRKTMEDSLAERLYRSKKQSVESETGLGMAVHAGKIYDLIERRA